MQIHTEYDEEKVQLAQSRSCVNLRRDGQKERETREVPVEHSMWIQVERSGEERNLVWEKLVCTPQYLAELVLGHLIAEGVAACADEIESVRIGKDGTTAAVRLKKNAGSKRESAKPLRPVRPIEWKQEWIFSLADHFAEGMPLHTRTWAVHSCFLAQEGRLLFACEDIGRHNAFDKVIGYGIRNGIDLSKCMVYSSGRLPVDMVEKAIVAGIPVLAAKAVPTAEAIHLAKQYGLTLIGAARRDSMRIYE